MPSVSRILEVLVYSLLNFFPFLVLALYPFRHCLRFSKVITGTLIGFLTVIQVLLGAWVSFVSGNHSAIASAVSTILYAAFYFLAVKKHFGKTLFTLLMISNLANLAVISAKCLEGLFFPTLATQDYRWSFSLMLFAVEAVSFCSCIFIHAVRLHTGCGKEPSGLEWRYIWLIPVTFYLMWYYVLYGNTSHSSLEIALQPKNTLFLLVINVGAFLIYYIVTRLVLEQNRSLELQEKNHQLTMQAMEYKNLQEKITDAAGQSMMCAIISHSCKTTLLIGTLMRSANILPDITRVCQTTLLSVSVKILQLTLYCSTFLSRQRIMM